VSVAPGEAALAAAQAEGAISFSYVRASGPGGQNVNKVSSAVQMRFDLAGTSVLDAASKQRLRVLAGRRVTADGAVLITARTQRSQEQNRREALARLADLIERASVAPKLRRATRPTRASQQRRLETKTRTQRTKRLRGKVGDD
jgi:ribosome-associated protein